ncbi:uncharacterized protein LOC129597194 [Paramacrobiotus metropolitanus]|uniref:uncharacterized protein LOC129597194 n=1 Tax=Paramacrobiotus metropolitanus TaxID=2943436 RepID=UPI00244581E2|nr:uncharacterized protein LOC129597194 [Paramacrobiotus metropolitanus]
MDPTFELYKGYKEFCKADNKMAEIKGRVEMQAQSSSTRRPDVHVIFGSKNPAALKTFILTLLTSDVGFIEEIDFKKNGRNGIYTETYLAQTKTLFELDVNANENFVYLAGQKPPNPVHKKGFPYEWSLSNHPGKNPRDTVSPQQHRDMEKKQQAVRQKTGSAAAGETGGRGQTGTVGQSANVPGGDAASSARRAINAPTGTSTGAGSGGSSSSVPAVASESDKKCCWIT